MNARRLQRERSEGMPSDRVDAAILELLKLADGGADFDRSAFLAQHPEAAEELEEFLAGCELVDAMAGPTIVEDSASAPVDLRDSTDEYLWTDAKTVAENTGSSAKKPRIEKIGRYQIIDELGRGGMGVVYFAQDTELERQVALKVPTLPAGRRDPELEARFYREARAAAALHHPGICPIYDVGGADGVPFLTMRYLEGPTLSAAIGQGEFNDPREIARLIRKLAEALAAAHREGVVHRDLKPGNVLFGADGEPVIADFGLALRFKQCADARLTQSGTLVGSPAYMSPEQVEADLDAIGPRSDIYSLGVILYELLTGRLPFQGSVAKVLGQIATAEPPRPSGHRPSLDPQLESICLKMMARRPEDRHPSMADVAEALRECEARLEPQEVATLHSGRTRRPFTGIAVLLCGITAGVIGAAALFWNSARDQAVSPSPADSPPQALTAENTAAVARSGLSAGRIRTGVLDGADRSGRPNDSVSHSVPLNSNPQPETSPSFDRDREWIPLFDGESLTGWTVVGEDAWSVEYGVLTAQGPGIGWLMTDREFADFLLEFEYRLPVEGASGVFLRAWPDGPVNGRHFMEVQLLDDAGPKFQNLPAKEKTASLFSTAAPKPAPAAPAGQWNRMRIELKGRELRVAVNDVPVLDEDLDDYPSAFDRFPGLTRETGHIGFQHYRTKAEFRNIRLRSLSTDGERVLIECPAGDGQAPPVAKAPFSADKAAEYQQAWADHRGVPVVFENSIGMKFRLIPPGEFLMGSTPEEIERLLAENERTGFEPRNGWIQSEAPQHRVTITRPFYMGMHEVTREQFRQFVDATGYVTVCEQNGSGGVFWNGQEWLLDPSISWRDDLGRSDQLTEQHPVCNVNSADADAFCRWLSKQEEADYRLPTEAEWEYACRAGTTGDYAVPPGPGDETDRLREYAWVSQVGSPHPVGRKRPNPFGLYDMHGNILEWCRDFYSADYYAQSPADDPPGPETGRLRVQRGGSFGSSIISGRSAARVVPGNPKMAQHNFGFRVMRTADPPAQPELTKAAEEHASNNDETVAAGDTLDEPAPGEPVQFEQWLAGRDILTVSQDGEADFTSIQAALEAMQPGEVVEVLDSGPYHENLNPANLPPDTGLISTARTVISVPNRVDVEKGGNYGHVLRPAADFRIAGFLFADHPENTAVQAGATMRVECGDGEVVVEDCGWFSIPLSETPYLKGMLSIMGSADSDRDRMTLRDCWLDGRVYCAGAAMESRLITRNVFGDYPAHGLVLLGMSRNTLVLQNVFRAPVSYKQAVAPGEQCRFRWTRNTALNLGPLVECRAWEPADPVAVTVTANLARTPIAVGADAVEHRSEVNRLWQRGKNLYANSGGSNHLSLTDDETMIDGLFPVRDPDDRNFARIVELPEGLATNDLAGAGAVPPGPAPPEGDWLTRLRDRWYRRIVDYRRQITEAESDSSVVSGNDWFD